MTTQPQNNDSHSHLFKIMTATLCTNGFEEELIQNYKILNSAGFRNTNKNVINTVTNISILKTLKRASGRNVCHLNVLCFFLVFLKLRDELFFLSFQIKYTCWYCTQFSKLNANRDCMLTFSLLFCNFDTRIKKYIKRAAKK